MIVDLEPECNAARGAARLACLIVKKYMPGEAHPNGTAGGLIGTLANAFGVSAAEMSKAWAGAGLAGGEYVGRIESALRPYFERAAAGEGMRLRIIKGPRGIMLTEVKL